MKPAIEGGKPVRKNFLIFGQPRFFKEELTEILDTLRSGWWGTGPKTRNFEKKFARFVGTKYVIGLASCTAALELALDILGVGPGDEVITTPITFVSTANVIVHRGAKPIFVDINRSTWNLDEEKIEEKITKKTKVILPVHLHGRPSNLEKIKKLAKKYNLYILQDAAHAIETKFDGKKIAKFGDFCAFSFYATKNIATGEGGMITCNKKDWAQEARIKSLHGISADAWKRYSSSGFKPYEAIYPGYKYNMTDIQASLGIPQLARIKKNLKIRQKYWQFYNQTFKNQNLLTLPAPIGKKDTHAMHLYAVLLNLEKLKITRDQFVEALKAEKIGVGIHFTPLHLHKYYRKTFGFKKGDFPNAEFYGERTVSLPFYPHMTKNDIDDVIDAVVKLVEYYKK